MAYGALGFACQDHPTPPRNSPAQRPCVIANKLCSASQTQGNLKPTNSCHSTILPLRTTSVYVRVTVAAMSSLTDLPLDILVLVFPYLDAKSFLTLCSTCKALNQESIRLDPAYWSYATQTAFRVPNQPVVKHDGARWQKMYRRMLTQSHVFAWGSNVYGRLGHSYAPRAPQGRRPLGRHQIMRNAHCSFPTEMENTRDLGIIADMQCG